MAEDITVGVDDELASKLVNQIAILCHVIPTGLLRLFAITLTTEGSLVHIGTHAYRHD